MIILYSINKVYMNNNINNSQSGLFYIDSRRRDYGTRSAFTMSWNEDISLDAIGLEWVIMILQYQLLQQHNVRN